MKKLISLTTLLTVLILSSCSENEPEFTSSTDLQKKTTVQFNGDIGFMDGSNFQSVSENEVENFIENVWSLSSHPDLDTYTFETVSLSGGGTAYYLLATGPSGAYGVELDLDGSEYSIIQGTACTCTSQDCGTKCNPKQDNSGEWYCSFCLHECTKSTTATGEVNSLSFS